MFWNSVTLRGAAGEFLYGYLPAASFSAWTIYHHARDAKHDGRWELAARCTWIDDFRIRQKGLLFTAPRDKGRWCWRVNVETITRAGMIIRAELGPPEQ